MNKNILDDKKGSILLETLISMNLLVLLLVSFSVVFLSMTKAYVKNLYQMELRTQMCFALECMVQDIKHADSVQVYQENGYDVIFITTSAPTGSGENTPTYIKYRQDAPAFYSRIIKKDQPLTGNNVFCDTGIRFTCKPLSASKENRVYLLQVKGWHSLSAQYFYLETAVTMLGKRVVRSDE